MNGQGLRVPTLYLSRTGMLEPLGQSQVLSYLCAFRHIRSGVPTTYDQPFRSIRSPRDDAVGRGLVMAPWLGPVKCRGCRASGAARAAKRAP